MLEAQYNYIPHIYLQSGLQVESHFCTSASVYGCTYRFSAYLLCFVASGVIYGHYIGCELELYSASTFAEVFDYYICLDDVVKAHCYIVDGKLLKINSPSTTYIHTFPPV